MPINSSQKVTWVPEMNSPHFSSYSPIQLKNYFTGLMSPSLIEECKYSKNTYQNQQHEEITITSNTVISNTTIDFKKLLELENDPVIDPASTLSFSCDFLISEKAVVKTSKRYERRHDYDDDDEEDKNFQRLTEYLQRELENVDFDEIPQQHSVENEELIDKQSQEHHEDISDILHVQNNDELSQQKHTIEHMEIEGEIEEQYENLNDVLFTTDQNNNDMRQQQQYDEAFSNNSWNIEDTEIIEVTAQERITSLEEQDQQRINTSIEGQDQQQINTTLHEQDHQQINTSIEGQDQQRINTSIEGQDQQQINTTLHEQDHQQINTSIEGQDHQQIITLTEEQIPQLIILNQEQVPEHQQINTSIEEQEQQQIITLTEEQIPQLIILNQEQVPEHQQINTSIEEQEQQQIITLTEEQIPQLIILNQEQVPQFIIQTNDSFLQKNEVRIPNISLLKKAKRKSFNDNDTDNDDVKNYKRIKTTIDNNKNMYFKKLPIVTDNLLLTEPRTLMEPLNESQALNIIKKIIPKPKKQYNELITLNNFLHYRKETINQFLEENYRKRNNSNLGLVKKNKSYHHSFIFKCHPYECKKSHSNNRNLVKTLTMADCSKIFHIIPICNFNVSKDFGLTIDEYRTLNNPDKLHDTKTLIIPNKFNIKNIFMTYTNIYKINPDISKNEIDNFLNNLNSDYFSLDNSHNHIKIKSIFISSINTLIQSNNINDMMMSNCISNVLLKDKKEFNLPLDTLLTKNKSIFIDSDLITYEIKYTNTNIVMSGIDLTTMRKIRNNDIYYMLSGGMRIYICIQQTAFYKLIMDTVLDLKKFLNRSEEIIDGTYITNVKFLPSLQFLDEQKVLYHLIIQRPGDMVILLSGCYYATIDIGCNVFEFTTHSNIIGSARMQFSLPMTLAQHLSLSKLSTQGNTNIAYNFSSRVVKSVPCYVKSCKYKSHDCFALANHFRIHETSLISNDGEKYFESKNPNKKKQMKNDNVRYCNKCERFIKDNRSDKFTIAQSMKNHSDKCLGLKCKVCNMKYFGFNQLSTHCRNKHNLIIKQKDYNL
ncbi:MAG: jmjC domain-containing protein [Cotesia congregata filamentous virus 2]